jgi:hypothetical protein
MGYNSHTGKDDWDDTPKIVHDPADLQRKYEFDRIYTAFRHTDTAWVKHPDLDDGSITRDVRKINDDYAPAGWEMQDYSCDIQRPCNQNPDIWTEQHLQAVVMQISRWTDSKIKKFTALALVCDKYKKYENYKPFREWRDDVHKALEAVTEFRNTFFRVESGVRKHEFIHSGEHAEEVQRSVEHEKKLKFLLTKAIANTDRLMSNGSGEWYGY